MIQFVDRNGPPEAMTCPVILCDQCLVPIQGAYPNNGIVAWTRSTDRSQRVVHLHKGTCDRRWEADHPGEFGAWEELGVFLDQLAHNTREPFPDEPDVEYVAPPPSGWRQGQR